MCMPRRTLKERVISGVLTTSMVLSMFTGFGGASAVEETDDPIRNAGTQNTEPTASTENVGGAKFPCP